MLLYRLERPQYDDEVKKGKGTAKKPSEVYGAEHLLRLFVKLPSLLAHSQMEESQVTLLQKHLADFIKWLQKNLSFFCSDYSDPVDDAYRKRVERPVD